MKKKQSERISFRASILDLTKIDHEASKLNMSRTDFIRFMIDEFFKNKELNKAIEVRDDTKLLRLADGIFELSKTVSEHSTDILTAIESQQDYLKKIQNAMPMMFNNFRKIAQAIIVSNPEAESEFKKIFTDTSLLEGK